MGILQHSPDHQTSNHEHYLRLQLLLKWQELFDIFKERYHDAGYRTDLKYSMVTCLADPVWRNVVEDLGDPLDKRRMRVLCVISRRAGWGSHTPDKVGLHVAGKPLDNYAIWPTRYEESHPFRRYPAEFRQRESGGERERVVTRTGNGNRAIRRARALANDGEVIRRVLDFRIVRALWAYEWREHNYAENLKAKKEYEADVAALGIAYDKEVRE